MKYKSHTCNAQFGRNEKKFSKQKKKVIKK